MQHLKNHRLKNLKRGKLLRLTTIAEELPDETLLNHNWLKYSSRSLIQRGSINYWFSEETISKWVTRRGNGQALPFVVSDALQRALSEVWDSNHALGGI